MNIKETDKKGLDQVQENICTPKPSTHDAIKFNEAKKKLKIKDLKTGVTKAKFIQLLIYAALFCLEYDKNPNDFTTELAIYQNSDIFVYEPSADEIQSYIDKIRETDLRRLPRWMIR